MSNSIALIPVFTGTLADRPVQLCCARALHAFMQVRRDFTTWIKGRIRKFGFIANDDYLLTKSGEQLPSGMKYVHDYHLTLDMAKELSMVENNEQGRAARRYFIACERQALAVAQPTPYTVQPSDTLNESQQIALRAMLESNVKRLPHAKQAGAMIKGWSKLKAHFGVPYRQIPAGEFEEALSIIARHVSEWELVDEAPKASQEPTMPELVEKMVEWVNAPNGYPVHLFVPVYEAIHARLQRGMEVPRIIDATDAPAMAQARKVAMDYFADYRAAVKCGKSLAEMDAIPSAALQGMIADTIMRQRMLISFDQGTGRMVCTAVPGDASVFSFATGNYTDLINGIPMQRLPELADSLNRRVASHLGAFSERLNRA